MTRGKFSLISFYERRVRRIFPALLVMLGVVSVLVYESFPPTEVIGYGRTLVATLFSASNLVFWSESGYFDGVSSLKPLLHTWSLGVEEQFYLLFPLFLLGIRRWMPSRMKPTILIVKLAARMCPAGNFINGAIAVQMMEPCIGVRLQAALEVLQMLPRMLTLAILRVREPDSRRSISTRGPVIAHISPQPAGLGLAAARRKHRHRRIVGVELGSGQHMLRNRIDQRSE